MSSRIAATWKNKELRRKILFTLGIIILYRIGAQIPSPGVNYTAVKAALDNMQSSDGSNGVYQLINLFSGGALLQLSIFALGIMPYITASIIVQLLTVVIPRFEELKKEGQSGQTKMTQYTRYLTVALALLQSAGVVAMAASPNSQFLPGVQVFDAGEGDGIQILEMVTAILVMTAGAILLMWLGELVSERGIGNGMSLLIFAGIASRMPVEGSAILRQSGGFRFAAVVIAALFIIIAVTRGTGAASYPGPVRQAYGRPSHVWWCLYLSAAEGVPGRCYPRHLRVLPYLRPGAHYYHRAASSGTRRAGSVG